MKEYFKYANGFVNLNDDNLFLTNSGNWQETINLFEKSPKSIRKNKFKGFKIYVFLIVVAVLFSIILSKAKAGSIPFGIVLLGLATYSYLKREIGKQYKIPISKIINIQLENKDAIIYFYNANDIEDIEVRKKVDAKGLDVLSKFNLKF